MFNQLLIKSIQIGEQIFHVLCNVNIVADDLEKLGVEIIKIANDIKNAAKQSDPEVKEETSPEPIQGE
jgi:hypothetical protein